MTREQIEQLAGKPIDCLMGVEEIERFAALVAANTRRQRDPVDSAIVQAVLPEAYSIINEMVRDAPELQKSLIVRARKLLPDIYSESFAAIRARGEVTPSR